MAERKGPDVPDGVELHKDGTVTIFTDGERLRLRRPKLGEFRKLRELLHEREDAHLRLLAEQAADRAEKPGEDASADDKLAFTMAINARSRALTDALNALNIEWVQAAMGMLAPGEVPAPDDWPSGMDSADFVAALVGHWRAVPLRSGGG